MSRFFGKVCQNGYVVRDIEAALKHWTEVLGVGPFYPMPLPCIRSLAAYVLLDQHLPGRLRPSGGRWL
jgi:hypothetical protein